MKFDLSSSGERSPQPRRALKAFSNPKIGLSLLALSIGVSSAIGQTWTPLKNQPATFTPGINLLLTDGTVLVQNVGARDWWRLTPDITGSYVNGTWSSAGSTQVGYAPEYFASSVLADGRMVMIGGEYNLGASAFTDLGAIYVIQLQTLGALYRRLRAGRVSVMRNALFLRMAVLCLLTLPV